jgi:hypothetical protein
MGFQAGKFNQDAAATPPHPPSSDFGAAKPRWVRVGPTKSDQKKPWKLIQGGMTTTGCGPSSEYHKAFSSYMKRMNTIQNYSLLWEILSLTRLRPV